jgi:hypothetical protein
MKAIIKSSILVCALLIGANVSAQSEPGLAYGIKASASSVGFYGDGAEGVDGTFGYGAGLFLEYTLESSVYLLSGLEFAAKGAKDFSALYLQVPVHGGYKIGLSESAGLGLHAGPYFGYAVGGDITKDGYEKLDFGVGFGADLILSKFRIGVGYDLGLTDITDGGKVKNRNIFLSIGYSF